mgnify:CR=1 FL=1
MHSHPSGNSCSCRDYSHSHTILVPGCLDGLHFEPSNNNLEECIWRWTIMQPPTLLCPRCTSHGTRISAECLVFSPIVLYSLFPFLFFFLFFWESGVTRGISMTAISEPLASCWHVVLALDCYTKREMDRVRKSIVVHLLAIFILFCSK